MTEGQSFRELSFLLFDSHVHHVGFKRVEVHDLCSDDQFSGDVSKKRASP